jgi:hypothetical protein
LFPRSGGRPKRDPPVVGAQERTVRHGHRPHSESGSAPQVGLANGIGGIAGSPPVCSAARCPGDSQGTATTGETATTEKSRWLLTPQFGGPIRRSIDGGAAVTWFRRAGLSLDFGGVGVPVGRWRCLVRGWFRGWPGWVLRGVRAVVRLGCCPRFGRLSGCDADLALRVAGSGSICVWSVLCRVASSRGAVAGRSTVDGACDGASAGGIVGLRSCLGASVSGLRLRSPDPGASVS